MAIKIADLFAGLRVKVDNSSIKAVDKVIGDLKYVLGGLGAAIGVNWFKGLIDQTVELGGKLNDTSQQVGVSATDLQELGYAAEQTGGSFAGMTQGLRIVQRNAYAASKGSKEAAKGFADLGVELKANGKLRPTADLLTDIAEKIRIAPESEKAALAMKAFGRAGAQMVPMFNDLEKLRERFRELGGAISEENVAALDDYGDSLGDVHTIMGGLRNQIVVGLLPTLQELVTGFIEWFKANRELIKQRIDTFVKLLGAAIKITAAALGLMVDAFGWLLDHSTLIIFVLTVLAVRMLILRAATLAQAAALALLSIRSLEMGIAMARAWIMASLPAIALIAVIALAILLIDDLYSWITGGESVLKDAWGAVLEALPDSWKHAIDAMKMMLSDFSDFVKDIFAGFDEMFKDYDSEANRRALRLEGIKRGLTGKELDQFVEQGVANEITGNAAGVNTGPILGRAGETAFDRTSLGRLFYSGKQQQNMPAAMRFAPPLAQAAMGAGGTFQPTFNITLPPGSEPQDFVTAAKTSFDGYWNEQLRRAKAGAGK